MQIRIIRKGPWRYVVFVNLLCVSPTLILHKPFYGEAVVWKRLRHVNVVPFLGVTTVPLQLVSKWMPNGTLTEYVNARPHADRTSLVRILSFPIF